MASVSKQKWTYNGVEKSAWMVRYNDGTGSRRGKTFEFKKDAEAFRQKVEAQVEKGLAPLEPSTATVADVALRYLRLLEQHVADGRHGKGYHATARTAIHARIIPALGTRSMAGLDFAAIEVWHAELVATGIASNTVKGFLGVLRRIERFAVKPELAAESVVELAARGLGGGAGPTRSAPAPRPRLPSC